MFPSSYEFHWDVGHVFFLGIFYGVLATILTVLTVAFFRWQRDLRRRRAAAIEWEETFHDLPQERRHCRHEFDGKVTYRICENGFDCETCTQHSKFVESEHFAVPNPAPPEGFQLPSGRLYHRGHTYVEPGPEGTLTIGLDEFAGRCFGSPDRILLPACGSSIAAGDRCAVLDRGQLHARIAAPIAGQIVEKGNLDDGWLYRLRPADNPPRTDNLLRGEEARIWMLREMEWLQGVLNTAEEVPTLADGGSPVADLVAAYPGADWDDIWGQVSLEA